MARRDDERWAFQSSGEIQIVQADASVRKTAMQGLRATDRLMGAAHDGRAGDFVLVGYDTKRLATDGAWIKRLDPAQLTLSNLSITSGRPPPDVIFRGIAEVALGRFVIIGEDARIFELHDDVLEDVAIEWDDPGTATVEPPATPLGNDECDFLRLRPESAARDLWRQVTATAGAAWVVGCAGAIARVSPFASPPRAERVSLGRATQTQYDEAHDVAPLLSSVDASCPDEMYFAANGRSFRDRERGRVWEIRSRRAHETASDQPVFATMELIDAPDNDNAVSSVELDSGFPVALSSRSGNVVLAFRAGSNTRGSAHAVGASVRYRLADGLTAAIEGAFGSIVLATESGRVIVAAP
jgi:hypothetical protein